MFTKIFPKIHTEGYKFIVIAGFITIILLVVNGFLGLIGLLLTIERHITFMHAMVFSLIMKVLEEEKHSLPEKLQGA